MELYNKILELCKSKCVNITTMCKEAGVSRGSLGDLKSGKNKSLSADALSKIANYFGVTVDYLLGKSEETKKAPHGNEELIEKLLRESSNKAVVVMFGGDGPKVVEIPPEAEETVKRMLEAIDKNNTD